MLAKARSSLEGDEKQKNPVTYHIDRRSVAMKAERYNEVKNDLQQRLYDEMDPTALTELEEDRMESHISSAAKKLLKETALNLNRNERQQLLKDITDEMMGFGPLEPLLEDPEVSDILVNGAKQTYVEVSGKLHLTDVEFNDNEHVMHVIDRIVTTVGRHVDEGSPMCDARLPDGSRVNVIIPPLAIDYPSVSIRKFKTDALSVSDLVDKFNSMSREMATLLEACVSAGLNILISGGTGAGKTTLLNILSGFIPQHERIVTIEDSAELQLQKPHVVRLETRPPNIEGKGEITPYDLLRNALRMRADRIILGEVRGEEALDMLQAMNTGHEGSMSTIHANTPRDAISRLENLVAMGGLDLPQKAMRKQIASAIDLIVQGNRFSDGTRKQTCISEVLGMEGDQVTMQDIFLFDREGIGENGKVLGEFVATGVQPRFLQKLKSSGVNLPLDLFSRE
ncbi:MAG: CpaF family protein [Candidatus Brocadiia bacterium]